MIGADDTGSLSLRDIKSVARTPPKPGHVFNMHRDDMGRVSFDMGLPFCDFSHESVGRSGSKFTMSVPSPECFVGVLIRRISDVGVHLLDGVDVSLKLWVDQGSFSCIQSLCDFAPEVVGRLSPKPTLVFPHSERVDVGVIRCSSNEGCVKFADGLGMVSGLLDSAEVFTVDSRLE